MKRYREIKIKSAIPIYLVGVVWILYAIMFPLYRWLDYAAAAAVSAVVYLAASKFIPGRVIQEEMPVDTGYQEADQFIEQCLQLAEKLKNTYGRIQNPQIRESAQKLLGTTDSILEFIQKHPQKTDKLRQFESYLLPTTNQLLENYVDLEKQEYTGSNIEKSKQEIEQAVPKISDAYAHILDDLYEDKAIDISVELEVMKKITGQGPELKL